MNIKTEQELEFEANAATAFLAGGVAQLMADGVEPASLVSALAGALGGISGMVCVRCLDKRKAAA